MVNSSTHSEYGPSVLKRIMLCPGSVQFCRTMPTPPTSPYAEEGTLLHSYMDTILDMWPEDPEIEYNKFSDHKEAVTKALNYLTSTVDLQSEGTLRFGEMSIHVSSVDEIWGTLDYAVITPAAIHIFDWKFGRGVKVYAKKNPQLLAYLQGFLDYIREHMPATWKTAMDNNVQMFTHIVQPRIDHYDCEKVTMEELYDFLFEVEKKIRLAEAPNPPFHPGEEQCRWCFGVCKTRLDYTNTSIKEIFAGVIEVQNNKATPEEISALLQKAEEVEKSIAALRTHAYFFMARGGALPKFKLIATSKNRKWVDGINPSEVADICEVDLEEIIETKLLSPAKLEKLVSKDKQEALSELWYKPPNDYAIAPESSSKPAVVPPMAASTVFAEVLDTGAGDLQ